MGNATSWARTALAASLCFSLASAARAQEAEERSVIQNAADMKLVTTPGLPTCTTSAVQTGDPGRGASILLATAEIGCAIPWHWHTPKEHLMIVSGVAQLEMKDAKSISLREGGFAMMPSRHVHQFRCKEGPCTFFVYSDAAFDIHYVDDAGKEIPPEQALKAVGETPAKVVK